jgi:DNA-binding response OmpR family regulator
MSLAGARVLIVEDEMLIAMDLEDMLTELGAVVVDTAMRLDAALELATAAEIDLAVLDVNIHGGRSYPVAETLLRRGVPFIFATGYGHAEGVDQYSEVVTLAKPYRPDELAAALTRVLDAQGNAGA